jgi:ABC-type multidrug transport system fused ATPase/permease subunit
MLLAIQNFFEYTGTITVDGRDIRGIPRHILRKNILTMPKKGVILDGTLRFNLEPYSITKSIPPSRRLSDEYIISVLQRMRLWQHIEARGGTLDSELSELRLGPEQKQLVSIARVILRKTQGPVCLLLNDCATDNLHPDTADAVESIIDDTFHSCTILTVSSRPRAEAKAEVVVKMRAGRIAGTFANGAPIDMDPYAFLKDLPWLSPSIRHRVRMAYRN